MIVWATEFPIPSTTRADDILALAQQWLRGSPHFPFAGTTFPPVVEGETSALDFRGHSVRTTRISAGDEWWVGCQHTWTEQGEREWTTQIVAHGIAGKADIGVRLDCNLLSAGPSLPQPKKPYILRSVLTTLGGGPDSWLTVDDEPTYLNESQVAEAAAIIEGTTSLSLPVVYVSATANQRPFVNASKLAKWLAGMAHVIVEPSRHFSFAVARNVARNNPYSGAIALLWPRASARQVRLLPRDFESADAMATECAARVRVALTTVRPTPALTWAYTQELVARRRLDTLRNAGSTALDEYTAAFDEELAAKQRLLDDSEREIGRLRSEVRRLEAAGRGAGGLFTGGNEPEYYPGELQDAVLYALKLAGSSLEPQGRRWHIVQDILATASGSGNDEEIAEAVKRCFTNTGELTTAARRTLVDLGFEITEDGRHYKALYQGDGRYAFTISKTSSDHRAGKNLASQINKTLFK